MATSLLEVLITRNGAPRRTTKSPARHPDGNGTPASQDASRGARAGPVWDPALSRCTVLAISDGAQVALTLGPAAITAAAGYLAARLQFEAQRVKPLDAHRKMRREAYLKLLQAMELLSRSSMG